MNSKITFKKELCGLVLLLFALSVSFVMPNHVYAADSDFVVDENGVLTKYNGTDGDVVIPDGVTAIGYKAFYRKKSITNITIPNGVVSIGAYAFDDCTYLKTIDIPDSVTSIGECAFVSCYSLSNITIPRSITSIQDGTFISCNGMKSITIPNSVTSIGASAFWNCPSLKSITIPDSVTSIGHTAFYACTGLTNINIPVNVTTIEDETFYNCYNLNTINIPKGVTSIGKKAFLQCDRLININIPKNVSSIGSEAFSHCSSLKSINIPESVTSIRNGSFSYCSSLKSIDIPESVTSIGNDAFSGCSGLTTISIPNSVKYIGKDAFNKWNKLESAYIYNKDAKIGIASGSSITSPIFGENNSFITLYGYKDSTTELCAKEWGYKFETLPDDTNKPLQSISLNNPTIALNINQTSLLKVIYNPQDTTDDKSVIWTSSNKNIATVTSKGKITGVSSGSAIVKAKVGKLTATCKVTVKDDIKPSDNKIYFTDDYKDKTVTKDETIHIPIKLSTLKDYYALDSSIKYDKTKLEFLGYSIKENYKDCYADSSNTDTLRFILASKGKKYPIKTSDDPIIYMNFKCISAGDTDVTITSTTLANLNEEVTIKADNLDKTTIHITETTKPTDINRDGKFSLIDLAIDAYYYGVDADETDKTKYDADIIPDGKIDDLDLMEITKNIINNK